MWILKLILITVIICIIFSPIWIIFFYLRNKLEKMVEERENEARINKMASSSYEEDDEDEDEYDYDDDEEDYGDNDDEYYIVQFWSKNGIAGWCDTGFSRSSETSAQNMFDDYVRRNPSSRSRLVQKRNGRVVAVLGSN